MMENSLLFPAVEGPGFGIRLNRWVDRWQRGGIEHYPLRENGLPRFLRAPSACRVRVTNHRLWIPWLDESFRGFRIVHLTDIHHGLFLPPSELMEVVEMANRLEPDLVALTGDFVTYSRAYIRSVAAMLGQLQARHGVFAVLGNHDFRVGADLITHAFRRVGISVLRNRHVAIHREQTLYVAGIDDLGYGADLQRALRGIPAAAPTLLLAHNPRVIHGAARHGVSLVLSGHTHGGQVHLPLVGSVYGRSPSRLRFKSGWDRLGATQIYVSRGIGTSVIPLRLRCPAEIPHFDLHPHRAPATLHPRTHWTVPEALTGQSALSRGFPAD